MLEFKEMERLIFQRQISLDSPTAVEREEEHLFQFSFSSEAPVARNGYVEILSHEENAVDLKRLNEGANLLFNHDQNHYIGVILNAWIEGKKGYCRVKFSDSAFARQIRQDVAAGILRNVSVGYRIHDYEIVAGEKEERVLVATFWEPLEISVVTVPADSTVGVGRAARRIGEIEGEGVLAVEKEENLNSSTPVACERSRILAIQNLAATHRLPQDFVQKHVEAGTPLDQVRASVLEILSRRQESAKPIQPLGVLGLTEKENRKYSLMRAIRYKLGEISADEAGYEIECSREIANTYGIPPKGIYIPISDLKIQPVNRAQRNVYQTGIPAQAGNLISTDLDSVQFIEFLRSQTVVGQLGAQMLSGLRGNLDIPRHSSVGQVYWINEGATIPQSAESFDLVYLRPKDVAARQVVTRRMLLQSSIDLENLIRSELAKSIAIEVDRVAIAGSGLGPEPLGVLNNPGVEIVAIGPNGGPVTWNHLLQLETKVAEKNGDSGSLSYLTTPGIRGALKATQKGTGLGFVWEFSANLEQTVNGYSAVASNQVPSNLVKGSSNNCHGVIFGDFSQILIGEWGILDLLVNPYGAGYEEGNVQIRAIKTIDVAVRQPACFAVIKDAKVS